MSDFSLHRNGADAYLLGKRKMPYVVPYRAKGNDLLSRQARNRARKLISIEEIMYLYDNICQICKKEVEDPIQASRDHIIPVSRGGESVLENLQLAHRSCNTDKGSKSMDDIEDWYFEDDELDEVV
jgi:5-methylcytosine-specific restriction endonuclease McrA